MWIKNLKGKRFGRLVAIVPTDERSRQGLVHWICKCDCGNIVSVVGHNLGQDTNSCGCIRNTQGGLWKHRLYKKWSNMVSRCTLPSDASFKYYGSRGIKVCDRWLSFPNFLADMEKTHFPGATIERIDNDKNYDPSNCKWATIKEQNRNKRGNVFIEYNGKRLTIAGWAEILGFPRKALEQRLRNGWPIEQALTTPIIPRIHRYKGRPIFQIAADKSKPACR